MVTQPVTLGKAASYRNGPAFQEGVSTSKGRVYLGKKSIGLFKEQVEGTEGHQHLKTSLQVLFTPDKGKQSSMSHGPLGFRTRQRSREYRI